MSECVHTASSVEDIVFVIISTILYISLAFSALVLFPLLSCFPKAWNGMKNDLAMLTTDPAFDHFIESVFAYPGLWALWWYRLSHALWQKEIYFVSWVIPRLVMSIVRFTTAVDIHPGAQLSEEGIMIDHAAGVVIGATAEVGAKTIIYHAVTLGSAGKPAPKGEKRHPTVGANCMLGAGCKILGAVYVGDNVTIGANSVVTKNVDNGQTVVGIPGRAIGANRSDRGLAVIVDTNAEAIGNLHHRLTMIELSLQANCISRPNSRPGTPLGAFEGTSVTPLGAAPSHHLSHSTSASPTSAPASSPSLALTAPLPIRPRAVKTNNLPTLRAPSPGNGGDSPNTIQEAANAKELAHKLPYIEEEEKRGQMAKYWGKLSNNNKQIGFQGLNCILDALKENKAQEDSFASACL